VLPPGSSDLTNDKPVAPSDFHWIGDKPILIYDVKNRAVLEVFKPVFYVDTTGLNAAEINKAVFGFSAVFLTAWSDVFFV